MEMTPEAVLARHAQALEKRRPWEAVWRECYDHVLSATPGSGGPLLYDATAADAAEQLSASLLAELTPPWSRWFGLAPSRAVAEGPDAQAAAAALEDAAEVLQGHFDRSNFALEMHQAFSTSWSPAPAFCWWRKRRRAKAARCASPPCR